MRRALALMTVLLFPALVMALPRLAGAQVLTPGETLVWDPFTVDFPNVGQLSAIAVDQGGRPHIAFRNTQSGNLSYARKNDNASWQVYDVDLIGDVGWGLSMILDGAGNPHFAYYGSADATSTGDLKYAKTLCRPNGASALCGFRITTVEARVQDPFAANSTSIDIDTLTNTVHIVYNDNTHASVKWARGSLATGWDITSVVRSPGGQVSMELDQNSLPHIAIADSGTGQIRYARVSCAFILCGWSFENVDQGRTPVLRRQANGDIHVAYSSSGTIRYAARTCDGGACAFTTETVAVNGNALFPGLSVDRFGVPHISFVREQSGELMYARRTLFGWSAQVADVDVAVTGQTSIVADDLGIRHISYPGGTDQSLRYTKGTVAPPPVTTF